VPGAVSAAAVLRWMRARGGDRWVVDGFPRNVEGAEVWEAADGAVWGALELRVGRAELARRLAARGRADDGAPVVARRLAGHDRDMPALRRFYRERGVYGAVDGVGDVHAVADRVRQWVDGRAARGPAAG
jgi:adenylate kinase family enzyme